MNRSKAKKQRTVSSEDPQTLILREIHQKTEVTQENIFRLYHLNAAPCQVCRTNSKDSPHCFCALIPPPGGTRKQGLWQKSLETDVADGSDPEEILRSSLSSPAGLTNLGATCYVNSVLQCLYRIKGFICGFFSAEAELVQRQSVLRELALLFGQLHSGNRKAVDSAPLATVLELNNSIQQDGQEFLKLLLTSLEGLLGMSKNSQARNVVKDVFRGTLSHVTRCSKCGQESAGSNQLVDFYELELNVRSLSSLEESLDDYFSVEQLLGDNQFLCESCNARVDATHCSKLRSLPPVLNFQLKRFVFDSKAAKKKKVTSKFSFPQTLDMNPWLNGNGMDETQSQGALLYDLSAILIHKGNTANSGHYVANIKDDSSGQWWEYDDELVSSLGYDPFGEASVTPKKEPNPKEAHNCIKSETKSLDKGQDTRRNRLTSSDAYMLIYNLRQGDTVSLEIVGSETVATKDQQMDEGNQIILPGYLVFEIEERNAELLDTCKRHKMRVEKELSNIAHRRQEVRSILAEAQVKNLEDGFVWISSNWLRTWADELTPPCIDNSLLLCEHDKVPPTKVTLMKCISKGVWESLQSKYGGGPTLSAHDCCIDCIMEIARTVDTASSFRDQRIKVKQMVENALASDNCDETYYFVSKTWLQNWLRRKLVDAPAENDASPTAAITCPHDALLPDNSPGAKRQAIPQEIWSYFLEVAMQVTDGSVNGCISFPVNSSTCCHCEEQISQEVSQQQDLRATKKEQRQKHGLLFSGECIPIVTGTTYYLVPSVWLNQWRLYLGASNKAEEPLDLEDSLNSFLCLKHKGLAFRPPKLQRNRRGELVQNSEKDDTFTIVSEDDWRDLCEQWNANPDHSIAAVVAPLRQSHLTENTSLNGEAEEFLDDLLIPSICTKPEICKSCIEERENSEQIKMLQYVDEEIYVDLVHGKEPPKSLLEVSKGERRISKRPRRGSSSSTKRAVLKVSGETTVNILKLQIWEYLGVSKDNQKLHFGATELTDDSATLADLGILPGAHLWIMDTGLHEDRDIAEELTTEITEGVEEGFSGTLLGRLPGAFCVERPNGLHQVDHD